MSCNHCKAGRSPGSGSASSVSDVNVDLEGRKPGRNQPLDIAEVKANDWALKPNQASAFFCPRLLKTNFTYCTDADRIHACRSLPAEIPLRTRAMWPTVHTMQVPCPSHQTSGLQAWTRYLKRAGLDYYYYVDMAVWPDLDIPTSGTPGRATKSSPKAPGRHTDFSSRKT